MSTSKTFGNRLLRLSAVAMARMETAMDLGAKEIVEMQKRLAPKDDGDLERSIKVITGDYKPANPNVRGVGASRGSSAASRTIVAGDAKAFYAAFVEFGTAAHTIAPKSEQQSLKIGGNILPAGQSVSHPGASATPFFYPAYRALKRRVKGRITRAARKGIKEAASE